MRRRYLLSELATYLSVRKVFVPQSAGFTYLKQKNKHINNLNLIGYFIYPSFNIQQLYILPIQQLRVLVLSGFAKLRKATVSFVMSVRLSAWKNSGTDEWIFMKFVI